MRAYKYNYKTREDEPYEIPDGLCYRTQGDKLNCASCGKEVLYEDGHLSLVLRNAEGLRYMVSSAASELKNRK